MLVGFPTVKAFESISRGQDSGPRGVIVMHFGPANLFLLPHFYIAEVRAGNMPLVVTAGKTPNNRYERGEKCCSQ